MSRDQRTEPLSEDPQRPQRRRVIFFWMACVRALSPQHRYVMVSRKVREWTLKQTGRKAPWGAISRERVRHMQAKAERRMGSASYRLRVARQLFALGLVLLTLASPAAAQGPGLFIRTDCTTLTSPVTGQTWCFDATAQLPKVWSGAAFTTSGAILGPNTFTGIQRWAKGADLPSAATVTLGTDGNYFQISGTTTTAGISTAPAGTLILWEFQGALILSHSSPGFVLPNGGANIQTAAGDTALFVSEGGGNWRCLLYQRALGASGLLILDRVTADTTVNSTTVETTVYTKSIPGGTLGTNVGLRLTVFGTMQGDLNGLASTLTVRVKYGATTLFTYPVVTVSTVTSSVPANTPVRLVYELRGDNTTNAQITSTIMSWSNTDGTTPDIRRQDWGRGTSAIDSTVAQNMVVTVQFSIASATDKFVMESALLEQL